MSFLRTRRDERSDLTWHALPWLPLWWAFPSTKLRGSDPITALWLRLPGLRCAAFPVHDPLDPGLHLSVTISRYWGDALLILTATVVACALVYYSLMAVPV